MWFVTCWNSASSFSELEVNDTLLYFSNHTCGENEVSIFLGLCWAPPRINASSRPKSHNSKGLNKIFFSWVKSMLLPCGPSNSTKPYNDNMACLFSSSHFRSQESFLCLYLLVACYANDMQLQQIRLQWLCEFLDHSYRHSLPSRVEVSNDRLEYHLLFKFSHML